MRVTSLALGVVLSCLASLSTALEVEERRVFGSEASTLLRVLSTADLNVFEPYIAAFRADHGEIGIDYTVSSSADVYAAIKDGADFDVVISSAMDLQFQLANDGLAQRYVSDTTEALPGWAKWRDLIFAFTSEPAVAVISTRAFDGLEIPRTRQDLISVLRANPERFAGAVGTYDVSSSGLGYLFATQEARISDAYWRLTEVMGRLNPALYCCSAQMIDDVASGQLAVAYNVLGSYAQQRLAQAEGADLQILDFEDFENVMLRTILIPHSTKRPEAAGRFTDAILTAGMRQSEGRWGLPPLGSNNRPDALSFGPIRLGPTLLVYLDPLNRRRFLESWQSAMDQRRDR